MAIKVTTNSLGRMKSIAWQKRGNHRTDGNVIPDSPAALEVQKTLRNAL